MFVWFAAPQQLTPPHPPPHPLSPPPFTPPPPPPPPPASRGGLPLGGLRWLLLRRPGCLGAPALPRGAVGLLGKAAPGTPPNPPPPPRKAAQNKNLNTPSSSLQAPNSITPYHAANTKKKPEAIQQSRLQQRADPEKPPGLPRPRGVSGSRGPGLCGGSGLLRAGGGPTEAQTARAQTWRLLSGRVPEGFVLEGWRILGRFWAARFRRFQDTS